MLKVQPCISWNWRFMIFQMCWPRYDFWLSSRCSNPLSVQITVQTIKQLVQRLKHPGSLGQQVEELWISSHWYNVVALQTSEQCSEVCIGYHPPFVFHWQICTTTCTAPWSSDSKMFPGHCSVALRSFLWDSKDLNRQKAPSVDFWMFYGTMGFCAASTSTEISAKLSQGMESALLRLRLSRFLLLPVSADSITINVVIIHIDVEQPISEQYFSYLTMLCFMHQCSYYSTR